MPLKLEKSGRSMVVTLLVFRVQGTSLLLESYFRVFWCDQSLNLAS